MRRLLIYPLVLVMLAGLVGCSSEPASTGPRPEAPFSTVPDNALGFVRVNIAAIDTEPIADGIRLGVVGEQSFSAAIASLLATGEKDSEVDWDGNFSVMEISVFDGGPNNPAPAHSLALKGRFTADQLGGLITQNGWTASGEGKWTNGDETMVVPMDNVAIYSETDSAMQASLDSLSGARPNVTAAVGVLGDRTKENTGDALIEGYLKLKQEETAQLAMIARIQAQPMFQAVAGLEATVNELSNLRGVGLNAGAQGELLALNLELAMEDGDSAGRALPGLQAALTMAKLGIAAQAANNPDMEKASSMLNRLTVAVGEAPQIVALGLSISMDESASLGQQIDSQLSMGN